MKTILRNTTGSPIEVNDLGIYLDSGIDLVLHEDLSESIELQALVASGDIVFINQDGSANTQVESNRILETSVKPSYEQGYTKQEVDTLVSNILGTAAAETLDTISEIALALNNDPNIINVLTDGLALKSDSTHNHDSEYSIATHNHDASYFRTEDLTPLLNQKSDINHGHGSDYSSVSHNHDGRYPLSNHDHDGEYYTKPQVDSMVGSVSAPIFGQNYHSDRSDSVVTLINTDQEFTKLTLTVVVEHAGEYRLGWFYNFNYERYDKAALHSFIRHESSVINEAIVSYYERIYRASTTDEVGNTRSELIDSKSGFDNIYLKPGIHQFKIGFKPAKKQSRYNVSMWNARLEFWRTQ